jgi:outer membrane lipoprotein-sorting protein
MTNGKLRAIRILALTIVPAGLVLADDAGQILKQTEETYRGVKSYRFEGTTVSETKVGGSVSKSETSFVVAFEKPNKFRVEYVYPSAGNWVRVSDGTKTWKHRSITKELTETAASEDDLGILDGSPVSPFWNIGETASKPSVAGSESIEVSGKTHDCFVIQMQAPASAVPPGSEALPVKFWVDKSSHLILREVTGSVTLGKGKPGGSTRTTNFTYAEVNQAVPGDLFHLAKK